MALIITDRVQETSSTTGTGPWTLAGATQGYQTFLAGIGNSNTTYYGAYDGAGNWEVGLGTYASSGNTLTRTTVLASSNSGSAVNFIVGVTIWVDAPAALIASLISTVSGQVLRSTANGIPVWSTATYPATAGTAANVLRSDGTNFLSAALAASDLSNGVSGTGAVALVGSPTFTGTVGAAAITATGLVTASGHVATGSTIINGLYLKGANNPALGANTTHVADWTTTQFNLAVGLHVVNSSNFGTVGTIALDNTGQQYTGIIFYNNGSNTGSSIYWDNTNSLMTIGSEGQMYLTTGSSDLTAILINTNQNIRFNAYGAGAATFDASGNITSVSDERAKSNILPFTSGLDAIRKINPIRHHYSKDSGLDTEREYAGFSAQNVLAAGLSHAVHQKTPDGLMHFNPFVVLAASVNAIKELDDRLTAVEKRIAA